MSLLPTSLVGSYPQPDWLIDREALAAHVLARVRARELWRVDPRWVYPAFVPDHPPAYSFLSELAASPVEQISIETAQSGLDLAVLDTLPGKTIILGVLALDTAEVETPETVAQRIGRALPHKGAGELVAAPDCGMKYLPRAAAFAKLQALVAGAQLVRAGLER